MKNKQIFDIKIKMEKIKKAFQYINSQFTEKKNNFFNQINSKNMKLKKRQSICLITYLVIFFGIYFSKNVVIPINIYYTLAFINFNIFLGNIIYSMVAIKKNNDKINEFISLIPSLMSLTMTINLYMNTLQQRYNDALNSLTEEEKKEYMDYEYSHNNVLREINSLILDDNRVEDFLNSIINVDTTELDTDNINKDYQEYLDLTDEYAHHVKNILESNESVIFKNKKLELK